MKRVLLSALLAATALQASAGIVNESFELAFTSTSDCSTPTPPHGWCTFGETDRPFATVPAPSKTTTNGMRSASVTALLGGPNNYADFLTFVGVSDANIRAKKATDTGFDYAPAFINGGAIKQTFTVAGEETLQFDWRFLTNERFTENDFSFFVLDGNVFALGDTGGTGTVFTQSFPDAPLDYQKATNWITYTHPDKLGAGSHTLVFAALQGFNNNRESSLLVDRVQPGSVQIPEPVSLGLVGLGLLVFGCNRRRKA